MLIPDQLGARGFGEEVTVQLTGDRKVPSRTSRRPIVRTTPIDYGKGRRNVHRVLAAQHQ